MVAILLLLPSGVFAQIDTIAPRTDVALAPEDTIRVKEFTNILEKKAGKIKNLKVRSKRDWTTWKPEAKRAMWMGIVFPGGGQIYNRKYWKLPVFYGGFVGCAYAWSWNNQMYVDYKQAYLDIMDDDESTHSYDQFLHLGNQIDASNLKRYQDIFSKRKDRFRRYRDMSFFCVLGVYALSVIDAYVDASLSEFDISEDLSIHIEPTYINNSSQNNPLRNGALGVQCSLNF